MDPSEICIGNRIGIGTFSDVHKGTYRTDEVALKIFRMLPNHKEFDKFWKECCREASLLKSLCHENVLCYIDFHETRNQEIILITEFIDGGSMKRFCSKNAILSIYNKSRIAQLCWNGLAYLHDCSIIHKDIKPENILVSNNLENVKICDFGLSELKKMTSTYSTTLKGTSMYLAPEFATKDSVRRHPTSSDVYAMGVTLSEFFSGEPFWSINGKALEEIQVLYLLINQQKTIGTAELPEDPSCWKSIPYDVQCILIYAIHPNYKERKRAHDLLHLFGMKVEAYMHNTIAVDGIIANRPSFTFTQLPVLKMSDVNEKFVSAHITECRKIINNFEAGEHVVNKDSIITKPFATDHSRRQGAGDLRNRRAKVVFSYTPESDDELCLKVNDIIENLGEEEEGWWRGRIEGKEKEGVFPCNFVKLIESNETNLHRPESRNESEEKAKVTADSGNQNLIQPKKAHGVGFDNVFSAKNKLGLRELINYFEAGEHVVNKDSIIAKPFATGHKPQDMMNLEYAKAIFEYKAENDDELTLKEADIILILSKTCEDPGWWQGELISNNKHGIFPDNFVELMTADEVKNFGLSLVAANAYRVKEKSPPGAGDLRNRRAKVVFSYTPESDDELCLKVNDIIENLGEEEEGWWRGRIEGKEKEGVFPCNFVKLIESNETNLHRPESRNESEEKAKVTADSGNQNLIQPKKAHGVGFDNIFSAKNKLEFLVDDKNTH